MNRVLPFFLILLSPSCSKLTEIDKKVIDELESAAALCLSCADKPAEEKQDCLDTQRARLVEFADSGTLPLDYKPPDKVRKVGVEAVGCLLGKPTTADNRNEAVVAELKDWADKVCECKDIYCARDVADGYGSWLSLRRLYKPLEETLPADAERFGACFEKLDE
jgi:hypothetical protein